MQEINRERLEVAVTYVERMSEGNNPVTGRRAAETDVINNPNVIRCMYFIREILTDLQENGYVGLRKHRRSGGYDGYPFEIVKQQFHYERDLTIMHFLNQAQACLSGQPVRKIGFAPIKKWLKKNELLQESYDAQAKKNITVPTEKGGEFGLYSEVRNTAAGSYTAVVYGKAAQEYIIEHLEEICREAEGN